jgi:hypothetical protein
MDHFEKLVQLVDCLKGDFEKFYVKNIGVAGTRVRKGMQEVRDLAKLIRDDVQNKKNSQNS